MMLIKLLFALVMFVGILLPVGQAARVVEDDPAESDVSSTGSEMQQGLVDEVQESHDQLDESLDEPLNQAEIHSLHMALDSDKDGHVSRDEALAFDKVSKKRSALADSVSYLIDHDTSKDGTLSLDEFMAPFIPEPYDANDPEYVKFQEQKKAEFETADVNGDGLLQKDEIAALVDPQVDPAMIALIAKAEMKQKDVNGDDKLDLNEFQPELVEGDEDTIPDEQFKRIDVNVDGFVDSSEPERSVAGVPGTEDFIDHLFSIADHDKDSNVTADELVKSITLIEESNHKLDFRLWHRHHKVD